MKTYEAQLIYKDGQKVVHEVQAQTYQQACIRALRNPLLSKPLDGVIIKLGERYAGFDANGRMVAGPTKIECKTAPVCYEITFDQIELNDAAFDGRPIKLALRDSLRKEYRRVNPILEKRELVFQMSEDAGFDWMPIHVLYDENSPDAIMQEYDDLFWQFENMGFPHVTRIKVTPRTFGKMTKYIRDYIKARWSFHPLYEISKDQTELRLYFDMRFERETDAIMFKVGFEQ